MMYTIMLYIITHSYLYITLKTYLANYLKLIAVEIYNYCREHIIYLLIYVCIERFQFKHSANHITLTSSADN